MVQKVHQQKVSEFNIYISKHIEPLSSAANIAKKRLKGPERQVGLMITTSLDQAVKKSSNLSPNCRRRFLQHFSQHQQKINNI